MEKKKIPVDPPDTVSGDEDSSTGTHSEASGHNRAESSESSDTNYEETDEIEYVQRPAAPKAGVHPVQVKVFNDNNVSRFLSELLINLQKVNRSAAILPHPGAAAQFVPLQHTKDIPNDESAQQFVFAYIAGLKLTAQGDTIGKVWLRSQAKFKNIKRDVRFSDWLDGSTTSPRIELKLSTLTGTKVIGTGIFLNVIARYDLLENFQDHIGLALESTKEKSGPVPEFQIEIIQRQGGRIRLYKMVTSSAVNAEVLNSRMARIMPSPSTDICYISYPVWSVLPMATQNTYYDMQQSFSDNHDAIRLRGVNNPHATIGKLNEE